MIDIEELKHLLLIAINSSIRAGALIMDVYNSDDFQVNLKSDATPLTLADRLANTEIVNSLMKTRIPVLSEEGRNLVFEERKGWEYFWLVDPLDGTKEFIKRNGEFTVNIALVFKGYPIMGVVYVPVLKQLFYALQDFGSFRIDNIDEVILNMVAFDDTHSKSQKLPEKTNRSNFRVVSSRSHPSAETQEYINEISRKYGDVEITPRGSSLKICMVAEDHADVYPRFGKTTEWDTAAGQAIAEMAGCEVVSLEDWKRLHYNKEDLENPFFIVRRLNLIKK
jgi:3'(2'), 5'-bisphosphate nucleotidase